MSKPSSVSAISRLGVGSTPPTTVSTNQSSAKQPSNVLSNPMNSQAIKSRTQSMKPSIKQSTQVSSKSSDSGKPKSFLTADALHTNLKFYQFLTRVQYMLIEGPTNNQPITEAIMSRASLVLRPVDYAEVVSERVAGDDCGWPPCTNKLSQVKSNDQRGRFKLDLRGQRVLESAALTFCSSVCASASDAYQVNLKEEPMYLRNFDAVAAQVNNQPHNNQSATKAITNPMDNKQIIRKQTVKQANDQSSSTLLIEPTLSISEREPSVSTDFTSALVKNSAPRHLIKQSIDQSINQSIQKPAQIVKPQTKSVSFNSSSDDAIDVDELMAVALREKLKAQSAINPIGTVMRDTGASDDEDDELQSEAETRANYASVRPPQSAFAQILRLAVHIRSEWTDTWCERRPLPPLLSVPSVDETERSRQDVLLSLVHQYAEPMCEMLGIARYWRNIVADLDAMALTFVVSEPVPKLSATQWKLLVLSMIHAVSERRNSKFDEVTWLWDGARAITVIKQLDWTADQANAIRGAVAPVGSSSDMFRFQASGVSALPPQILPSIFSFLDYYSLLAASVMSRAWKQDSHDLIDTAYDTLMHEKSVAHAELKLKKVGYVEGLDLGRERLMQQGFDESFPVGVKQGWSKGFEKGLLAAIALVTHSAGRTIDPVLSEVQRVCGEVNANVMHFPGMSSSSIRLESDVATLSHQDLCALALERLGIEPATIKPRFDGSDISESDEERVTRIDQQIDQLMSEH